LKLEQQFVCARLGANPAVLVDDELFHKIDVDFNFIKLYKVKKYFNFIK